MRNVKKLLEVAWRASNETDLVIELIFFQAEGSANENVSSVAILLYAHVLRVPRFFLV